MDKAIDHTAAHLVHQVAVPELEVADPGEVQALDILLVGNGITTTRYILCSHNEEPVALDGAVGGHAGGGKVAGGHIQVDGAHAAAVAQLLGVEAAGGTRCGGTGAEGAVKAVLEGNALGLVAVGVDVGNVVAHDAERLHVGFHARDGRAHCSCHSHNDSCSFFNRF